ASRHAGDNQHGHPQQTDVRFHYLLLLVGDPSAAASAPCELATRCTPVNISPSPPVCLRGLALHITPQHPPCDDETPKKAAQSAAANVLRPAQDLDAGERVFGEVLWDLNVSPFHLLQLAQKDGDPVLDRVAQLGRRYRVLSWLSLG